MIQLFGKVFGQDASTWNFGKSSASAGAIDSANTANDEANFMSVSAGQRPGAGIAPMVHLRAAAFKSGAVWPGTILR